MRRVLLWAAVAAMLLGAMLLMSMAQNDFCLPWQESVGVEGSPFSGTKDKRVCR